MAADGRVTTDQDGQESEQSLSPFRPGDPALGTNPLSEDRYAPASDLLALPWAEPEGPVASELEGNLEDLELDTREYDRQRVYEGEEEDEVAAEADESPFAAGEETEADECCRHDAEAMDTDFEDTGELESDGLAKDEEALEEAEPGLENEEEFDASEESAWEAEWREEELAAARGLTAGSMIVDKVPLLRRHSGIGPDLILAWNQISGSPSAVDVVVHLHGYSLSAGSRLHIVRDLKPRSGLDWADPTGGSTAPGRARPTLALLPRGHFYGGTGGRAYSFPALTAVDGIRQLVDFGLQQLAASLGVGSLAQRRLILTAHSGGGAALLRILRHVDPDEVHVFDGLYQDADALTQWATRHILKDQAVLAMAMGMLWPYMAEQGGALRVLYRGGKYGTARHSGPVATALSKLMAPDSALRRWYRVERTTIEHLKVPPAYGWRLLADASADVPDAAAEPAAAATRSPQHEFTEQLRFEGEGPAVTPTGAVVRFPSGATLPVIVGPGTASIGDDYFDPTNSGNPLLDTSATSKSTRLSANFTVRELTTSGGVSADIARIDPKLVDCLQRLRDHVGKGITITSGFRSWKRNRDVYAARKKRPTHSQHCAGRAADIKIGGMNGLEIAKAAIDSCGPNIGIGVGDTYAHVDVRGVAQAWNYGGATKDWVLEVERYQRERGGSSSPAKPPSSGEPQAPEELVRFAQRVLNATENERLDADGKLGRLTRAAVARFRSKYGLGAGDVLDDQTGLALAQRALEELAQQSMFQIGVRDAKTEQKLADFKRMRGVGFDATVDAATRAALGEALARRGSNSIAVVPSGGHPAPPAPSGVTGVSLGIDTASVADNRNPSWADARARVPLSFAIIRSNYGVSEDKVFKRDWPKIRDAGMVRGPYLFLRFPHPKHNMKAPDPVSQANAMIRTVGVLDESDLPPTVDVEFPGGRKITRMTVQQCLDGVVAAWKVLKEYYGAAPMIYTSARVWREDLDNLPAPDLLEAPLWLKRWPFEQRTQAVHDVARVARLRAPEVPPPLGDASNWWIHQYQGDALKLPGFPTGDVDMNRFNVTLTGMTGDRIKWVQRRLGISQTGVFDTETEAAVRAFQGQKGLPADGAVDVRTFARLCWSCP
jgi:peptidoglycan hydrolase-like protein with peptidoglycan-binding domain